MLSLIHSDQGLSKRNYEPSIFLAGPSPRGRGDGFPEDWRDQAIPIFEKMEFNGILYIPRPTTGNSTNYDGQIEWELHHLDIADCIMFWVPRKYPEMKAATTNVEYGLYVKNPKSIYGRPEWAEQVRYLDHLYDKFLGRPPFTDLEKTIEASISMSEIMCQMRH